LNPSFTGICRQTMSSRYLDEMYLDLKSKVELQLKALKYVAIAIDSSHDESGEPVSHIVALGNGRALLLEEINHGTEKTTAENLCNLVSLCVDKVQLLGVHVMGFITDNENTMRQ